MLQSRHSFSDANPHPQVHSQLLPLRFAPSIPRPLLHLRICSIRGNKALSYPLGSKNGTEAMIYSLRITAADLRDLDFLILKMGLTNSCNRVERSRFLSLICGQAAQADRLIQFSYGCPPNLSFRSYILESETRKHSCNPKPCISTQLESTRSFPIFTAPSQPPKYSPSISTTATSPLVSILAKSAVFH